MIPVSLYRGQKIAVLGLARSGLSAAKSLLAGGAEVLAWDDDAKNREAASAQQVPLQDLQNADWKNIAALVLSPGIPHTHPAPHPAVTAAKKSGVKIISDIYLLMHTQSAARYVGITGTNGKSTTTALIAHILKQAGHKTEVGGNLGQAALTLAPLGADGTYVLELSSYQLELMPDCRINTALLLNITPDHLERHGGMAGYAAAKKNIFQGGTAIVGVDDEESSAIFASLPAPKIAVAIGRKVDGVYVLDGILYDKGEKITDLRDAAALPGAHNWQNAAFAYAACIAENVSRETICKNILNFPGLAHRQEKVARIGNVDFINDSKATNPEAAAKALACYKNIYWIAGGLPKGKDLDACAPFFKNIREAFLIGEAAPLFGEILSGKMKTVQSQTLARAVDDAFAAAQQSGGVILLSPACASFDQFRDFEHRGETFRALALGLLQKAAS